MHMKNMGLVGDRVAHCICKWIFLYNIFGAQAIHGTVISGTQHKLAVYSTLRGASTVVHIVLLQNRSISFSPVVEFGLFHLNLHLIVDHLILNP